MTAETDTAPSDIRTMIVAASGLLGWRLAGALEAYGLGQAATVDNAEAAFGLLCRETFDLVLLMHQPPHLDGVDLVRGLRALPHPGSRDCHVVMIVEEAGADLLEEMRRAGIDKVDVGGPSPTLLQIAIEGLRRHGRRPHGHWPAPQWLLDGDKALL